MNIFITDHAIERGKERLGINKKTLKRTAKKAFSDGIRHKDITGSLKRYLDRLYLSYRSANNMRIYNHYIYLFEGRTLITVQHIPNKYKNYIKKIKNNS